MRLVPVFGCQEMEHLPHTGIQNSTILGKLRKALATVKWVAVYSFLYQYALLEILVLLSNNIHIIRTLLVHLHLDVVVCGCVWLYVDVCGCVRSVLQGKYVVSNKKIQQKLVNFECALIFFYLDQSAN